MVDNQEIGTLLQGLSMAALQSRKVRELPELSSVVGQSLGLFNNEDGITRDFTTRVFGLVPDLQCCLRNACIVSFSTLLF